MLVEIDWGSGFIKHHVATLVKLGAGYRITVVTPKQLAGSHPPLKARVGGREALHVRIENVDVQKSGTALTIFAAMPAEITIARVRLSRRPSKLRIPLEPDQRFRLDPNTDSGRTRSLIPTDPNTRSDGRDR